MADISPLDYNPFEGDFGEPGDRTLSDAMVCARKEHACTHCEGPIAIGETYRSRSDIIDGSLMRAKWCALCCDAMVAELRELWGADGDSEPSYPFETRVRAHGIAAKGG